MSAKSTLTPPFTGIVGSSPQKLPPRAVATVVKQLSVLLMMLLYRPSAFWDAKPRSMNSRASTGCQRSAPDTRLVRSAPNCTDEPSVLTPLYWPPKS